MSFFSLFKRSDAETAESVRLTKELDEAAERDKVSLKMLLLGAGGSGKTTFRKQLANLYAGAFQDEASRSEVRETIINNLLEGARAVVAASFELGVGEGLTRDESLAAAKHINSLSLDECELRPETVDALQTLWQDPAFQDTYEQRDKYQLQECVVVFFGNIMNYPAWGGPDWVPSVDDCVRARMRSSGVVELRFRTGGATYRLFDAGGQRAERRKWLSFFDDVHCLIFMGSLTDYSEVLYEDHTKNRLEESLAVFEEISRTQTWPTCLLLNKLDLFTDRYHVKHVPLNASGLFPDAPVDETYDVERAFKWMSRLYQEKMWRGGQFAVHALSAVDTKTVDALFADVKLFALSGVIKLA